jgi:hypothetical protein
MDLSSLLSLIVVSLLGFGVAIHLVYTLYAYPLFDFAFNDLDWTREWFYMTLLDYYSAAVCLSLIAIWTEGALRGLLWSMGFILLGGPLCCLYIVYRFVFCGGIGMNNEEMWSAGHGSVYTAVRNSYKE